MTVKDLTQELEKLKIENNKLRNHLVIEYSRRILAEKILRKIRFLTRKL